MRIIVTGAAGFVGRHLMKRLIAEGHDVLGLDHDMVAFHNEEPNLKYAELLAGSPWPADFDGVDVVFHLAAEAPPAGVQRIQTLEHNATIDLNVFRAAKVFGVKRVIYASSITVEGEMTPYSTSKRVGELVLEQYTYEHTAIRFNNIFGPGQREDYIVPKFINQALRDGVIKVRGNGGHWRRFLYVDQAVDMYMGAMEGTGLHDFGHKITMMDLAHSIAAISPRLPEIEVEYGTLNQSYGDIPWILLDGLKETYDYYAQLTASPVH